MVTKNCKGGGGGRSMQVWIDTKRNGVTRKRRMKRWKGYRNADKKEPPSPFQKKVSVNSRLTFI